MSYDALIGFDFLNKVIMKLEEGPTTIASTIPKQLNNVNAAEGTNQMLHT